MRTIETNVYSFDELSDNSKQKAIDSFRDINTDYGWWECTYDDAENIGLTITEFDLGRSQKIKGKLSMSLSDIMRNIISYHGKSCDTYKTAQLFFRQRHNKYRHDRRNAEQQEEVEKEYLGYLLGDYFSMLDREYDYLTSDKAIIETIRANEYEFTENGEMV